jgi:hypothetical protein
MPYVGMMQATAQNYQFASTMQNTNQDRMALAGGVQPYMSQQSIAQLAEMDKALTLQGIQAQVMYEATQAMQEANRARLKKEFEARAARAKEGYLY